jgi:hypothetical protein
LYKTSVIKRHFKKVGIKDPITELNKTFSNPHWGLSAIRATGLVYGLIILFLSGSYISFINILNIRNAELDKYDKYVFSFFTASMFLINYFLLFRHDKYLKYFKKFDKKPRKWKIKWAWITLGILVGDLFLFFGSMILL